VKYYPLLVVGATFTGIGIAKAAGQNALVVDSYSQPGHEFIACYRPGGHWDRSTRTEQGERLLRQLVQRHVLDADGRLHIPAVLPVWCEFIRQELPTPLLLTTITDIRPHPDGYAVTIFNVSGLETFIVGRIIDTTAQGLAHLGVAPPAVVGKSINAMLHHPEPAGLTPQSFDRRVTFARGKFDSEWILKVELQPSDDWITARRKLHDLWSARPESLRSWKIAAVADTFELRVQQGPSEIKPNWLRLPSGAYANLLEAFEEGVLFAGQRGVEHEPIAVDP